MRVATLTPNGFELREAKTPAYGPNEILIRSLAIGICEGDVFHYREMRAQDIQGRVLGHEGTGEVVGLGANVRSLSVGDVVTTLGGPYAEFYVASENMALRVPANVEAAWALGEPIACCVHAAQRFGIRLGDRVALVGCGFMGLGCLQLARLQGASFICALEPIGWRRDMAETLGADAVVSPATDGVSWALKEFGEFDVVIEATGVQSAIDVVGDLVKQHGRVILVGYHQTNAGMRSVNMQQWNYKAIDVVNGHVRRTDEKLGAMRAGLALLSTGRLSLQRLVTRYPFARVGQAFEDLVARKQGLFKAVLVPEG